MLGTVTAAETMRQEYRAYLAPTDSSPWEIPAERKHRALKRTACLIGTTAGIFGGVAAILLGLVCSVAHQLISTDTTSGKLGTLLLIAGIPMMLVGSLLMDEIEKLDLYPRS